MATAIIEVTVSTPYVMVGGGWTGLRPQGLRRDYKATVFGVEIQNTSKSEIARVIRRHVCRETGSNRVTFTFVEA